MEDKEKTGRRLILRAALAVGVLAGLVLAAVGVGARVDPGGDDMALGKEQTAEGTVAHLPALDMAAPKQVQTATFALG